MEVLVAGMGNVLRSDDAFGVKVAERLLDGPTPQEVRVIDVGIGGIHLVQELFVPVDALVIVDAVEVGKPPGTVVVMTPDVLDVTALPLRERHDQLADMHYAVPERALMLARAMEVLPQVTWIVGCQAVDAHSWGEGMAPEVEGAVDAAANEVRRIVAEMGIAWSEGRAS